MVPDRGPAMNGDVSQRGIETRHRVAAPEKNMSDNPPSHPPILPPAAVLGAGSAAQSTWPTAIGILGIVLGALGSLGGAWGLAPFIMKRMFDLMPKEAAVVKDAIEQSQAWLIASSLVMLILSVLLLVIGIGVLHRRRRIVRLVFIWAVMMILYIPVTAAFQYRMQQSQFEVMAQQSGNAPPMPSGVPMIIGVFSCANTLVLGWALPVFLLIWFRRSRIRAEWMGWS